MSFLVSLLVFVCSRGVVVSWSVVVVSWVGIGLTDLPGSVIRDPPGQGDLRHGYVLPPFPSLPSDTDLRHTAAFAKETSKTPTNAGACSSLPFPFPHPPSYRAFTIHRAHDTARMHTGSAKMPFITSAESAQGILAVVDGATRAETGGAFVSYDGGKTLPW